MTQFTQISDAEFLPGMGVAAALEAANCNDIPSGQAFTVDSAAVESEGGTDPVFGSVTWKTLISAEKTPTDEFVLGIAQFGPGGTLHAHRHVPAEFYLGLEGDGVVTIDGVAHVIRAGVALYIPGDAEHATVAGPDGLRFAYGFAEAAFTGITYNFSEKVA
ncbi:MAG: cupin domain-containing protein [Albidovulum sp.]